jgi:glycine/D-amino acid oxidase-like deaminating enzyme
MKYENPPWDRDSTRAAYESLRGDHEAEVLIIGGGIAGILAGYTLTKRGYKVVLVEKGQLCTGATGVTTAFLTQIIDTDVTDLITMFGVDDTSRILASHREAISFIEQIAQEEDIECEFTRCSDYLYANTTADREMLEREHASLREVGVESRLSRAAAKGFTNQGYLEVPEQAKFHPLKFALVLAERARAHGMQIFEASEVDEIVQEGVMKRGVSNKGSVSARWVVSSTYEPFGEPLNLFFKKGMYKSFVQEYEIPQGCIPEGIYEDTKNPYHFFRIDPREGYDRMIIGGEDHKILVPASEDKQFAALTHYVDALLPGIDKKLMYQWSGPILEPGDALAFVGPSHDKYLLYAMAFSGNGMTYAGIAATIIADLIEGRDNRYYELYRTSRVLRPLATALKARDFVEEFVGGVLKNAAKHG